MAGSSSKNTGTPPVLPVQSSSSPMPKTDLISVTIKIITGAELKISISKWAKVKHLKRLIQREKPNIRRVQDIRLVFGGEELDENAVLDHYGIGEGSVLNLSVKMTTSVLHESSEGSEGSERSERTENASTDEAASNLVVSMTDAGSGSGKEGTPKTFVLTLGQLADGTYTIRKGLGFAMGGFDMAPVQMQNATPPNMFIPNDPLTPQEIRRYRSLAQTWNELDSAEQYSDLAVSWDAIGPYRDKTRGKLCALCDTKLMKPNTGKQQCPTCNNIFCNDDAPHNKHEKYFK